MSRKRIYIPAEDIRDHIVVYEKDIIHKLKDVVRLIPGDEVFVFDGKGKEHLYRISQVQKSSIDLEKLGLAREEGNVSGGVILGFPLAKEDKIDLILQKATELGVSGFMPFISERSIQVKPSFAKKERWQRIIVEAARQAERLWLPSLLDACQFEGLLKCGYQKKYFASLQGEHLSNMPEIRNGGALIVVGPEGDFSEEESALLQSSGFQAVNLSDNILRVETAAIFAVGLLKYLVNKD